MTVFPVTSALSSDLPEEQRTSFHFLNSFMFRGGRFRTFLRRPGQRGQLGERGPQAWGSGGSPDASGG